MTSHAKGESSRPLPVYHPSSSMMKTTKTSLGQTNLDFLRLISDPLKLHFLRLRILVLINIGNKTWTKSSRHFYKFQKADHLLRINLKLSLLTSIVADLTERVKTCVNSAKPISLPLKLLDQTKFRL